MLSPVDYHPRRNQDTEHERVTDSQCGSGGVLFHISEERGIERLEPRPSPYGSQLNPEVRAQ